MRELHGVVRFGIGKTIGFPRLIVNFETSLLSDSCVDGEAKPGALPRIFGLAKC